jgi:hypothetical protein
MAVLTLKTSRKELAGSLVIEARMAPSSTTSPKYRRFCSGEAIC